MPEPRGRGVRLSDLDRALVYRIAFVGRRWEVLGPEGGPDVDAGGCVDTGVSGGAARTGAAYVPRHAAPARAPGAPAAGGDSTG